MQGFGGTQPDVVVLDVVDVVDVVVVVVPWIMSVNATVSVGPPGGPVPIIVTILTVEGAFCATARVSIETVEPSAGGVTGLGLKAPDTPAGNESTPRFTSWWKPRRDITVTVAVAVPGYRMTLFGLTVRSNDGAAVAEVVDAVVVVVVEVTVNVAEAAFPVLPTTKTL